MEVLKKVVIFITILIAIKFGILALLYGQILTSIVAFIINTHYTGKLIDYNAIEQSKDILPAIGIAMVSGALIYSFDTFIIHDFNDIFRIIIGGILGILSYVLFAYVLKFDSLTNIKSLILKR